MFMNYKNKETDSGSYVNGVWTTKNGYTGYGMMCPRGGTLYDTTAIYPMFKIPEDTPPDEVFVGLEEPAAPDVRPYYAISNYGRLLQIHTGKIMKENYRNTGYGYYCLSCKTPNKNGKYQKKYTSHRIIMETFEPREDMKRLQVNHINGVKKDNYINKRMPDGTLQSNLEWVTAKENIHHADAMGLRPNHVLEPKDVRNVCRMLQSGIGPTDIAKLYNVVPNTIYAIKKRKNFTYISKDYDF